MQDLQEEGRQHQAREGLQPQEHKDAGELRAAG